MSVSSTPAKISIHPSLTGWRVQIDGVVNDMIYRSGADAEASARSLGEALAAEGGSVEIQLFLRDGARAARVVCAPRALAQVSWEADTAPQR